MYKINRDKTSITPIEEIKFSDIQMKERNHIQKCIVSHPEILGEELLIIQEEFNQFEVTDERFDLLALDKNGNLVVIENKRDDSGKDVTWQAIKYASYCSTLTRQNVIEIFNQYLKKQNLLENADEIIVDFLSEDEIEASQIYPSEKQRIILVSHNFRPEVLSAAQWLLNNKVDISCVQIKPYKYSEDLLLLDADIIIPQAAIKDYTLKIVNKMDDIQTQKEANNQSAKRYLKFWKTFDEKFNRSQTAFKDRTIAGNNLSYIDASADIISGIKYSLVANRKEFRAELYCNTPSKDRNKEIYDYYLANRDAIENVVGKDVAIKWQRLDDKRASRISIGCSSYSLDNEEDWDGIIDFLIEAHTKLSKAISSVKKPIIK